MKLSMYVAISLDGFIAKPDGNIDWLTEEATQAELENDAGYAAFLNSVDALVMGGKTYRQMLTFGEWPYHDKKCVVISKTETASDLPGVIISDATPEQIIDDLQAEGHKHVWIMGGGKIHSLFLRSGLIDEMRIFVMPLALGEGIPLFAPPVPEVRWQLISHKTWRPDIVELIYRKREA